MYLGPNELIIRRGFGDNPLHVLIRLLWIKENPAAATAVSTVEFTHLRLIENKAIKSVLAPSPVRNRNKPLRPLPVGLMAVPDSPPFKAAF